MQVLDRLFAKVIDSENTKDLQENLEIFLGVVNHELNLKSAENEELKSRVRFMEKLLDMCSDEA